MTLAVQARLLDNSVAGRWRIYVRAAGRTPVEVTTVRGLPTRLESLSWEDPFGPRQLTLRFPGITILDSIGSGDLWWLQPDADIDVVWDGPLPRNYPTGEWNSAGEGAPVYGDVPLLPPKPAAAANWTWRPAWRWEGFFPSLDIAKSGGGGGEGGLTITAVGGLRQLDCYLAKPEYPARPMPYEWALARQFRDRVALRMSALQVIWPTWWTRRYTADGDAPWFMQPVGVREGEPWTGFLTRSTGAWEPALTSYVQGLLTTMYTERGRFTLDLHPGRAPVLSHRDIFTRSQAGFIRINPVDPTVEMQLRVDTSSGLGVVFGQGKSRTGSSYTGMRVSNDGQRTYYEPLAAIPQVHPETDARGWLDPSVLRREVMLELSPGLTVKEMTEAGQQHLRRFANPGITGTITLKGTVTMDGERLHHMLVRAGMSVVVDKLFGRDDVVLHVTEATVDFEAGTTSLTVDSQYRDALTVAEVRERTRDALAVPRMLIGGQYKPPVDDMLVPWNYLDGSGCIPSGPLYNAWPLFEGMPDGVEFPWTDWTRAHPPKDPRWQYAYIPVGPASANANENWAAISDRDGTRLGFPIRLSQQGQIRLLQLAAYDRDGNVLPVEFHFSLYQLRGVTYQAMPKLTAADAANHPPYKAGQYYPFFRNAWEKYDEDGTLPENPQTNVNTSSVGLIKAWGTHYERAGHFPGAQSDPATGLLVDEETFDYDITQNPNAFDPYSPKGNLTNPDAGMVYAMVYCDAQGDREVFFLGRMFRQEPGAS